MKNRRGFTLVELIISIVLLGVIGGIIIYNVTSVSSNSKKKEYENFVNTIKSAANVYAANKPEAFNELYSSKAFLYITTGDLIENGYLDEKLTDPYTKEAIKHDELIKAILDNTSGSLIFEYPVDTNVSEQFMVGIDDYVIYGEPYDCYQGIGTYRLALSDEKGNLINLTEKTKDKDGKEVTNKEKYHFECKMPNGWTTSKTDIIDGETIDYSQYLDENGNVLPHTTTPGIYDIEYFWISDSGTKKTATRKVSVLESFKPDLEVKSVKISNRYNKAGDVVSVSGEEFDKGTVFVDRTYEGDKVINVNIFTPSYDCSTKTQDLLVFRPVLSGADLKNTTYKITKKVNDSSYLNDAVFLENRKQSKANDADYTGVERKDFDHVFTADDGDVFYHLETKTVGHYFKNYYKIDKADIELKQELILDECRIKGASKDYSTERSFTIDDPYSPVGVYKYEVRWLKDNENSANKSDNVDIRSKNVFTYTLNGTKYQASILAHSANECSSDDKIYTGIQFRPINKDGYVGNWNSKKADLYITNNVSTLTDKRGNDCASSCKSASSLGSSLMTSSSISNLNCYYCAKKYSINYGGNKFIVLGKFNNGDLLLTTDVATISNVSGTMQSNRRTWTIQTCDGVYSASFNYTSPVFGTFKTVLSSLEGKVNYQQKINENPSVINYLNNGGDPSLIQYNVVSNPAVSGILKPGYDKLFKKHTWRAIIGYVDFSKMPDHGIYRYEQYSWKFSSWASSFNSSNNTYSGYFGIPTKDEVTQVFKNAMISNHDYWLGSTVTKNDGRVQVRHGDSTVVKNTYFEYMPANSLSPSYAYIGSTKGLKVYMIGNHNNLHVCYGNGSYDYPYIVSEE